MQAMPLSAPVPLRVYREGELRGLPSEFWRARAWLLATAETRALSSEPKSLG